MQIDSSGERSAYEDAFRGVEGGVGGALRLLHSVLRGWLAGEATAVLQEAEAVRGPELPLPLREDLAKLLTLAGRPAEAEALLVLEATLRERALGSSTWRRSPR